MSKVVREDIDNLNAVLTITIDQKTYEPKFLEELKKYRNKAHMRGFRRGKTPLSFLKKAYGKGVLSEIVHQILQEEISKFFQDAKSDFLGQPIPSKDWNAIDFDARDLEDYIFKFDIGIAPSFEVQGVEPIKSFEQYAVEVTDDMINEEMDRIRKSKGERFFSEDDIEDNDIVELDIKELDGDAVKEGGWESKFSILVSQITNEDTKKELLTKKKGDTLTINVFELEDGGDEHAKKYFLNMTEEDLEAGVEVGQFFEATIETASRIKPAELNQEFFDGHFGKDAVSSEEEARAEIKKDIAALYEGQSDGVLFRNIHKDLLASNKEHLPLPDDFLKRWLKVSSDKNTDEVVEKDYERFADNLRWSLIKGKLAEKHEIKIDEGELREAFREQIMGYFGGNLGALGGNMDFIESTIERVMQDQEQVSQVSEQLMDKKVFQALKENFALSEKSISVEDFGAELERIREEDAPPAIETEEEE